MVKLKSFCSVIFLVSMLIGYPTADAAASSDKPDQSKPYIQLASGHEKLKISEKARTILDKYLAKYDMKEHCKMPRPRRLKRYRKFVRGLVEAGVIDKPFREAMIETGKFFTPTCDAMD